MLRLPTETHARIWGDFSLKDMHSIRRTCRSLDRIASSLLEQRMKMLCERFISTDVSAFLTLLTAQGVGITGTCAVWFANPSPDWFPNQMDITTPINKGFKIELFLDRRGWKCENICVLNAMSFVRLRPGFCSHDIAITVKESWYDSIWPQILSASSTIDMTVVTPTSFFAFYPEHLDQRRCVVRQCDTAHSSMALFADDLAVPILMGFSVMEPDGETEKPCAFCFRWWRRLKTGRGIRRVVWNANVKDGFAADVVTSFSSQAGEVSWMLSAVCYNSACISFNTPYTPGSQLLTFITDDHNPFKTRPTHAQMFLDERTQQRCLEEFTSPLMFLSQSDVERKLDRIRNSNHAIGCLGLYFSSSFPVGRIVPVPRNHGIQVNDIIQPEDLVISAWMQDMRCSTSNGVYRSDLRLSSFTTNKLWNGSRVIVSVFGAEKDNVRGRGKWKGPVLVVKHTDEVLLDMTEADKRQAMALVAEL